MPFTGISPESKDSAAVVDWTQAFSVDELLSAAVDEFFTTTLIEWSWFNPHPGHVVASLDRTLYNDYLCLVASNKQQIQ